MIKMYNPEFHHRRSIWLKGYDYSQPGAYFVTLCTRERTSLFGNVVDGKVNLNQLGNVIAECWQWLCQQYPYVKLDEFMVMPNHLHGIIIIADNCRGDSRIAPTKPSKRKPLGRLIGAFKTVSTKQINEILNTKGTPIWQRNYYEHIIRDEDELNRIREYVIYNPLRWQFDRENPENVQK